MSEHSEESELAAATEALAIGEGAGERDETLTRYLTNLSAALRRVEQLRDPAFRAQYIADSELPRALAEEGLSKELNAARQDLVSATNAFKSYHATRTGAATAARAEMREERQTRQAEATAARAETREERLTRQGEEAGRRADVREERQTKSGEVANEIARGRLAVDEAQQRLAERRAEIEADVATGRLTLDQGKLEWDKEYAGLQIAERALDRLETGRRHEETLGEQGRRTDIEAETSLRGQDISQRGQDVSLAERLGATAQEAALGAFRASSPEGTTAFFNEALRGLGPFSPGGAEAIPQLARPDQIRIPRDITQVGVRTAGGILGGQIPILPPQVGRPELPKFQPAGVVSPQEAQAVDEVLAEVLEELAQGGGG